MNTDEQNWSRYSLLTLNIIPQNKKFLFYNYREGVESFSSTHLNKLTIAYFPPDHFLNSDDKLGLILI